MPGRLINANIGTQTPHAWMGLYTYVARQPVASPEILVPVGKWLHVRVRPMRTASSTSCTGWNWSAADHVYASCMRENFVRTDCYTCVCVCVEESYGPLHAVHL